nr:glycine--tRNA ligase subunit alpha [Candidatus Kuenenia stuttgartiensis]
MTFQEIILTLQKYWADYGCILWQPYDTEKGREPLIRNVP